MRATAIRSRLKPTLARVVGEGGYSRALALAKACDIRLGRWTEPELDLLPHLVKRGDTVLDVGANYGLYSYHLGRLVGNDGVVLAFEAVPEVVTGLRRVRRLLRMGNVIVVPQGVAATPGETVFEAPVQRSGAVVGGLARIAPDASAPADGLRRFPVSVTTLDEAAAKRVGQRVGFVKIDIEGAELRALQGAEALLRRDRPFVLCEVGRGLVKERYGIELHEFSDLLDRHSYDVLRWDPQERSLRATGLTADHDGNYLFAPKERLAELGALLGSD